MSEPLELWAMTPSPRGESGYPRLVADDRTLEVRYRGGHSRTFRVPDHLSVAAAPDESSKLVLLGPSGDSVLTLDPQSWVPRLEQLDERGWEDVDLTGQSDGCRLPRRFAKLLARLAVPLTTAELTQRAVSRGERSTRSPSVRLAETVVAGMFGWLGVAALSLLMRILGMWDAVAGGAVPVALGLAGLAALWASASVVRLTWISSFANRHRADRPAAAVLRPQPQVTVDAALAHRTLIAVTPDSISVVLRGREVRHPRHGPFGVDRVELMTVDEHPVQFALTASNGVAVDMFVWGWWFPDGDTERLRTFAREAGLEVTESALTNEPGEGFDPDAPSPEPVTLTHWATSVLLPFLPMLASAYAVWLSTISDNRFSEIVAGVGVAGVVVCLGGAVITAVGQFRADRRVAPVARPGSNGATRGSRLDRGEPGA